MSVIKVIKEVFHCTCDHSNCRYEWDADAIPQRCAKCQRRTWNRPTRIPSKKPLTFNGETLTIAQWSRKLGLAKTTIPWRIKQSFPMEQVLSDEDWRRKEEQK
jgi:hypothetical protein